ncbi:MBG domain-containing protein, partial [Algoriphagus aquimarinus]
DAGDLDNEGFALGTDYNQFDAVGTYNTTIAIGTATDNNYNFTPLNSSTFEVGKLDLAVTAVTGDITYGDAEPTPTVEYAGFVNGDDAGDLDNEGFALGTDYNQFDAVGTYNTTIAIGTATDNNYNFTPLNSSTFEVGKLDLQVTADPQSKFCGQVDPDLTYQITYGSLVNNDELSGELIREEGEVVGTYAILKGTLDNSNYAITYVGVDLSIEAITIDASESGTPVQVGSSADLSANVSPGVGGVSVIFEVTNEANVVVFTSDPVMTNSSGEATVSTGALNTIGVYKVTATVGSGCSESVAYLPVYDPNGSFVTGGGWIMSPAGAYKADVSLTGKANFGFVSKYKKGSSQVDGNTEFQFKAGDLNFKSTLHESGTLVISGKKATYRGEGTINGQPGYKFTLVALDGDYNGGTASDEFRIKIWGGSGIIYDNGLGADDNADDATTLGGGSIVIHEAKGKGNKRIVTDLVSVPWNTPSEEIEKKITSMSSTWFEGKAIKLTINSESYNALQPGLYEFKANLLENEWFALEEPITVNVLVADKPLATDIKLSNSILLRNIHNGSLIGDLNTIDPVDDQHTYSIAENTDFELVGKSLVWKGTEIPATARITVFSTDRAGQTIERAIELSREPRFGDFNMFPNPAESDVTIEVELEQSMNVGIRIYDAVGRLVFEDESVQNGISKHQINIDHLSPGLYTVQLKTGQLVMNKRLIKK